MATYRTQREADRAYRRKHYPTLREKRDAVHEALRREVEELKRGDAPITDKADELWPGAGRAA